MSSISLSTVTKFFNQGWVGALIGLFSLLLAVYLFRRSQVFPRLSVQMSNTRLIGGRYAELPTNVSIYYQKDLSQPTKTEVSQLSKTTIVIWNSGKTTFRSSDIVNTDPLRFQFDSKSEILDLKVTLKTRDSNSFVVHEDIQETHIAICEFDFLDPQDGVRIEVLHTSDDCPTIYGTIRGLPQGVTDWGALPRKDRIKSMRNNRINKLLKYENFVYFSMIVVSILVITANLFPDLFIFILPSLGRKISNTEPLLVPGRVKWEGIFLGLLYGIPPSLLLWYERRRFPKKLDD
ncbi:MAG: hypothetical protein QNJ51_29135 [Calothrix sp. MO_167.B12]|nr:hypothetical protein [Calothrix sp. MO_167.B12]